MAALGFTVNTDISDEVPYLYADRILNLAGQTLAFHMLINNTSSMTNAVTGSHSSLVFWNSEVNSLNLFEYTSEHFTQTVYFREPTRNLHIQMLSADFKPLHLGSDWVIVLRKIA